MGIVIKCVRKFVSAVKKRKRLEQSTPNYY